MALTQLMVVQKSLNNTLKTITQDNFLLSPFSSDVMFTLAPSLKVLERWRCC